MSYNRRDALAIAGEHEHAGPAADLGRGVSASRSLKLLHVVPTYLPAVRYGGPIVSVHGLCKALVARGHEVTVLTTSVDGSRDSPVAHDAPVTVDGVQVRYHRSNRFRRLYFSTSLAAGIRRELARADLMHLHSVFLWPTLAAAWLARRAAAPYVLSPRGMLVRELIDARSTLPKRVWLRLFERANLAGAEALHFTTELEQSAYAVLDLPVRPHFVVPNGVDLPDRTEAAPRTQPPIVLFLGRINWKKGLEHLIPALTQVPGARLVLAGNDEENYAPRLRQLASDHEVADRVEFRGFVSGDDKQELLRQASVLVLPSHSENFGNVVLEAWAQACPVIVSPGVGIAEIVRREGGGLVSAAEAAPLGAAIRRLLDDENLRRSCADAGARIVRERYSWQCVAAMMEAEYLNILAASRWLRA
jgi:glycosyltransferase involved in cell wall biosynthesis